MEREGLGWSSLLGMGISTAAVLAVGLVVGWLVDNALDSSPAFLMVGLALGIVGSATYIVLKFREYLGPSNGSNPRSSNSSSTNLKNLKNSESPDNPDAPKPQ